MKKFIKKLLPDTIVMVASKLKNNLKHNYHRLYVNKNYGSNIKNFKDKYKGKRCFIIGNGPSLTIEDLEKIQDEFTFASHLIFKTFDKTSWRPTFYCVEDVKFLENNISIIEKLENDYKYGFFTGNFWKNLPNEFLSNGKNNFWFVDKCNWEVEPDFSNDISKFFAEGFTVTYANIQLAVYMGFSEIYLIGVDHFYEAGNDYSKAIGTGTVYNAPQLDKTTISYSKARKVCDEKGIKIMNATRGGHLEVFERANLDSIIGVTNE
ncbi:MAG: DUF115 domain-containing protein [Eubacterium sp.]|nr:DUF115 domain-containing protein [Eubacterium sp.]